MFKLKPYLKTIAIEAAAPMDGGILYFLGGYFIRLIRMFLLIGVWRSIFAYTGEFTPVQESSVLQYTLLASAFYQQLDVKTTASLTFWEGTVSTRFTKPISIFGQFIAETIGRWLPGIVFFTLPVLIASPLIGVNVYPQGFNQAVLACISLLLGISTGFALDFIFTGVMVVLGNMHYFAYEIRSALVALLSGAIIPLYVLPWRLGEVLELLPFASMAAVPLEIYTSTGNPTRYILLQSFWCIVLWVLAFVVWNKNKQRMVIFGG